MGLRRAATASLAGLLAALSGPASPGAQAPEAQKPELILPTSVEVVRLEVVVTEKRGHARAGLTREDFAVLEDGKPQPIVQFQAFARPQPAPPARPAPPAATEPAGTEEDEAEDLLPARYVVLAIDDVHMEFESLSRVRKALTRFLDEDLRPEDQVALVTTSGASALSQEFTSDRAVLQQTLSRLSAQGHPPQRTDIPYISEYQAELIENEDPMALDAAAQEVLQAGLVLDLTSAEEIARRKARGVLTEAVYDSRLTLETLESLCRGLSGLTGRKALFLVSDGFLTSLSARGGTTFDLRRIADAGTRAGVVVYALDTRGLVAAPPGAGAASLRRPGPATFGAVEAIQRRSLEATRDAMNALAADTGGFLVENSNNLRAGLREMLKDTETYYVLAYEPTNTKRDGGFRRIEVRLPGVPGARVRTRSGYFAPDDGRLGVADGTAEAEARRAEQRRSEMRTALNSLAPLNAIPVRLSADFVSLDPGVTQVVVSGSVDVATLPFVRRRDRRQATVESVALVYDETGAVAATLPTERSAMDLTDADYEQLLRAGPPVPEGGRAPARPVPGAPRGPGGRHGAPGQRVAEGRDPGSRPGAAGPQQPLPPEGGRGGRGAGEPGRRPRAAHRPGAPALPPHREPLRAALRLQPEAGRLGSDRPRRAGGGPAGRCRCWGPPRRSRSSRARPGPGLPHLPDQAPALRSRRLRAAGHRHRPQRERDGDARSVAFTVE